MNLADEIRQQIEKNKGLKLGVGEINNHLSILEGLVRKDIMERVDDAYQRGLEDGKTVSDKGCVGCKWEGNGSDHSPCDYCCNCYSNQWTAKDDKIEVGDEVEHVGGCVFIVTNVDDGDNCIYGIDSDGLCAHASRKNVHKTGRHFDIQSILEAMKHD